MVFCREKQCRRAAFGDFTEALKDRLNKYGLARLQNQIYSFEKTLETSVHLSWKILLSELSQDAAWHSEM